MKEFQAPKSSETKDFLGERDKQNVCNYNYSWFFELIDKPIFLIGWIRKTIQIGWSEILAHK